MVRIENLSRKWDNFRIRDISLDIEEGEFFVILGPTGSGKTLFLELLAGFYKPDSGKIIVDEEDYTSLSTAQRGFGFVYQDYMLFPHLTVRENIGYGLKIRKTDDIEEKVKEAAEMVEVTHLLERYPSTLSGGEQQRVALARALILQPEILLLDEPFGSLDYQTTEKMRKLIKELHSGYRGTIIHVTHDQEEAVILGDRIAVMRDGRIVQIGKPEDIMRKPRSHFVAKFVGTGNIFHGNAKLTEDTSKISINGIDIHSTSELEGNVTVTIRPEDIIITEKEFVSSARNTFEGKITKIIDRGVFKEVRVEVGIPLIIYVTRQSIERLNIAVGKRVFVLFKASAVHVFRE
ncbi:MAG: tungstate ABC transporter ATP-binding protein WtpC [Thermoplasmatota archaeon]